MLARSFNDEESTGDAATSPSDGADTPEYTFEGFTVDFSDRVMLTPVSVNPAGSDTTGSANDR
jgi:hypothetical protein